MNIKKFLGYALSCLALIFLLTPIVGSAADMEILSRVDISTERRHAWNPWVEYNPDKDEFFVIWNSTGKVRDDCSPDDDYDCIKSFQSIEAARIAPSGKVVKNLTIIPPKGPKDDVSWLAMPRIAYNTSRKEYLSLHYLSTDTCVQCHDRNIETGEVTPADPAKCILCHPGDGPGLCNLVSFHDAEDGADCLTCHTDCVGGEPPVSPSSHPQSCMTCHEVDGPQGIHSRPGHVVWAINLFTMRLDGDGNVLTQPKQLYDTPASSGHPVLVFNSTRQEYLIGTADRFHSDEYDNVGFIVDEDATIRKGPFFFGEGSDGSWSHFLYYGVHNPIDDTYLIPWEDFRHATGAWYFGPNDIYGALLDGDGNTLVDIPIIEDFDEGEHEQWYPCVAHNPDKNEFFAAWFDERPSLVEDGGIVGRLINADGSFKGEPAVLVDTNGSQGDVAIVYAQKHKKYFIVYQSTQDFVQSPDDPPWYFENDIYARWVDENGLPLGEPIPIYKGEGDQTTPQVSYSPKSDRFFITWWDTHAPDDFEPLPGETGQFAEISSVVMGNLGRGNLYGVIYGTQLCAMEEIYGEDSREVTLLRNVRDTILNKTPEGKALVELYYQWSPAIVKALQEDGAVKEELKKIIDSIMPFFGAAVH